MIPKRLHLVWMKGDLPPAQNRVLQAWQQTQANWDIRLWSEEDARSFVAEHYPRYLEMFNAYGSSEQRADAFRYFVLNTLGGLCVDLGVEPARGAGALTELGGCFVGVQPQEHSESARNFTGLPYFLSAAFMGSEPGHPFWPWVFDWLERCRSNAADLSTGSLFLTGAALAAPQDARPAVLMPGAWSPRTRDGRPSREGPAFAERVARKFTIVGGHGQPLVSHSWPTVPQVARTGIAERFSRLAEGVSSKLKRIRKPAFAGLDELYSLPSLDYDDQDLVPPAQLPSIYIALPVKNVVADLPTLVANIEGLDYPRDLITIGFLVSDSTDATRTVLDELKARRWAGVFAGVEIFEQDFGFDVGDRPRWHGKLQKRRRGILGTCRTWLARRAAELADYCVCIDADVYAIPPDAITHMLSARRPVVMANCLFEDGRVFDANAFVFHERPDFAFFYRNVGRDGTVYQARRRDLRSFVPHLSYLRIAPLDGVGGTLLLIDCKVIRAGVVFPSEPYKFHLETEGFALMARDRGFEVCALPDLVVRHPYHVSGRKARRAHQAERSAQGPAVMAFAQLPAAPPPRPVE